MIVVHQCDIYFFELKAFDSLINPERTFCLELNPLTDCPIRDMELILQLNFQTQFAYYDCWYFMWNPSLYSCCKTPLLNTLFSTQCSMSRFWTNHNLRSITTTMWILNVCTLNAFNMAIFIAFCTTNETEATIFSSIHHDTSILAAQKRQRLNFRLWTLKAFRFCVPERLGWMSDKIIKFNTPSYHKWLTYQWSK